MFLHFWRICGINFLFLNSFTLRDRFLTDLLMNFSYFNLFYIPRSIPDGFSNHFKFPNRKKVFVSFRQFINGNSSRNFSSSLRWLPLRRRSLWSDGATRYHCVWLQVIFFSIAPLNTNQTTIAFFYYSCSICQKKQNIHFIVPARNFKLLKVKKIYTILNQFFKSISIL